MPEKNLFKVMPRGFKYMNVAILFSGGKDSTLAVETALAKAWNISYLLSVKPTRKDCYLFHYATVEHTPKIAEMLGLKHKLVSCSVANAKKEAEIVKRVVEKNPVDAVVLGGTGLQETQIRSIKEALAPIGIKVFASHEGLNHGKVLKGMLEKGYEICITQFASAGFDESMLGLKLTKDNFKEFEEKSRRFGFHIGGEGGYYDTFVLSAPFYKKAFEFEAVQKIVDGANTGHIEAKSIAEKAFVVAKN